MLATLTESAAKNNPRTENVLISELLFSKFGSKISSLLRGEAGKVPEDLTVNSDFVVRVKWGSDGFQDFEQLDNERVLGIINAIAGMNRAVVNEDRPWLETELIVDGFRFRFTGTVRPLTAEPTFAIRFAARRLVPFSEYIDQGVVEGGQAAVIAEMLERRDSNMIIAGGAGSGKTTFANACLAHVAERCPEDRVVIIEDTRELQFPESQGVAFCATEGMPMRKCVELALRYVPDRIVVGEVRGAEGFDLLKAWNTGHRGGIATVHANSAEDALYRLETLASGAPDSPDGEYLRDMIGRSVGLIVFLTGAGRLRRISEVARVRRPADGRFAVEPIIGDWNGRKKG